MGDLAKRQSRCRRKAEHEDKGEGERKQDDTSPTDGHMTETRKSAVLALGSSACVFRSSRLTGNSELYLLEALTDVGADRDHQRLVG